MSCVVNFIENRIGDPRKSIFGDQGSTTADQRTGAAMAMPLSNKDIDRLQGGTTERLIGKHVPASAGLRVNLSLESQVKSGWSLQRMGWEGSG